MNDLCTREYLEGVVNKSVDLIVIDSKVWDLIVIDATGKSRLKLLLC